MEISDENFSYTHFTSFHSTSGFHHIFFCEEYSPSSHSVPSNFIAGILHILTPTFTVCSRTVCDALPCGQLFSYNEIQHPILPPHPTPSTPTLSPTSNQNLHTFDITSKHLRHRITVSTIICTKHASHNQGTPRTVHLNHSKTTPYLTSINLIQYIQPRGIHRYAVVLRTSYLHL